MADPRCAPYPWPVRVARTLTACCLAAIGATGCAFAPIDLVGRQCPCDEGWTCDAARMVCVRDQDAATRDAGLDAGAPRDTGVDAPEEAPSDAGEDASAVVDAGVDAAVGPTDCDRLGGSVWLCDDFEGDLRRWREARVDLTARLALSDDTPRSGRRALRVTTTVAGTLARLRSPPIGDMEDATEIWTRFYVRVHDGDAIDDLGMMRLSPSSLVSEGIAVELGEDARLEGFVAAADPEEPERFVSSTLLAREAWSCVELRVTLGEHPDGSAELYVNGASVAEHPTVDTVLDSAAYDTVELGVVRSASTQSPMVLDLDDIAVGPERIGCD